MPESTVYVGRPTQWGNPYRVGDTWDQSFVWHLPSWSEEFTTNGETRLSAGLAKELFEEWAGRVTVVARVRQELHGKNLACWCPLDQPCHADVLLEWANPID